jgi:hypothetical protein
MSSRTRVIAVLLLALATASPPVDAQQVPKIAKVGLLAAGIPATAWGIWPALFEPADSQ